MLPLQHWCWIGGGGWSSILQSMPCWWSFDLWDWRKSTEQKLRGTILGFLAVLFVCFVLFPTREWAKKTETTFWPPPSPKTFFCSCSCFVLVSPRLYRVSRTSAGNFLVQSPVEFAVKMFGEICSSSFLRKYSSKGPEICRETLFATNSASARSQAVLHGGASLKVEKAPAPCAAWKLGPENRKNEVKLHPPQCRPWSTLSKSDFYENFRSAGFLPWYKSLPKKHPPEMLGTLTVLENTGRIHQAPLVLWHILQVLIQASGLHNQAYCKQRDHWHQSSRMWLDTTAPTQVKQWRTRNRMSV